MQLPFLRSLFWGPLTSFGLWIAVLTFAIDQAHKWWMLLIYRIEDKGRVPLLPFLDIVYVVNPGVSFGQLAMDGFWGQLALTAFAAQASP